jgi:hypothetical protein
VDCYYSQRDISVLYQWQTHLVIYEYIIKAMQVSVKTRVRDTSETVVGDVEVQDQRHRDHHVRPINI